VTEATERTPLPALTASAGPSASEVARTLLEVSDLPLRREPPEFHPARVVDRATLAPRLVRVALEGAGLVGFEPDGPAASLRLLLPRLDSGVLEVPVWNGNEFLHADGSRPPIRTLTPLDVEPDAGRLGVAVVLHGDGPLSTWAGAVAPGDQVAVSGPGRGYQIDQDAREFVIAGDESALPAILTVLAKLPATATARVLAEVADPTDRVELSSPAALTVEWVERSPDAAPGSALLDSLTAGPISPEARVWVAGEAAGVQRIRKHLFDERGVPRSRAVIRGYWKLGRAGAGS
jgi:NADPH-dependent ferric siderophore reductase